MAVKIFVTLGAILILIQCLEANQLFHHKWMKSPIFHGPKPAAAEFFHLFKQRLDHFYLPDNRTWNQLYYLNDQFYKPGGPVFLMIGGEGGINELNYDYPQQWVSWGIKQNALLVYLEHRFYGTSQPFSHMETSALRYLTIDQALADVAMFRDHIMELHELEPSTKWISFGCSYSASLAVWARVSYPHHIHGSVASSAPILRTVDFGDYLRIVSRVLSKYCYEIAPDIEKSFKILSSSINSPEGQSNIKKTFRLCNNFDLGNKWNQYAFFDQIITPFHIAAESGAMGEICDLLLDDSGGTMLQRIASLNNDSSTYLENSGCIMTYNDIVNYLNDSSSHNWKGDFGMRQWFYQTCTELGYFQTFSSLHEIFSKTLKLEYFIKICNDVFDLDVSEHSMSKAIVDTNVLKGGRSPMGSNIIFVNGLEDPWHVLSVLEPYSDHIDVSLIEDGYQCQDMEPSAPRDSDELVAARKQIYKSVQNILNS